MKRIAAVLSALLLASACSQYRAARAKSKLPHIVLVSIDTLHVNWTGPYNPDVETTPFLDRFAAEGIRFEHAYTQTPITLPSHAALMTGVTPPTLGVMANGDYLPDEAITLAEILRENGYRTAGFTSLGVLQSQFGMQQGFENYHEPFVEGPVRWYRWAHEIFGPAKKWLEENRGEPFFLWVHFSDPHEPYVTADAPPDCELWLDDELLGRYNLQNVEQHTVRVSLPPGEHRLRWVSLREPGENDRPETALNLLLLSLDALRPHTADILTEERIPLTPSFDVKLSGESETVEIELVFAGNLVRPTVDDVLPAYEANVAYTDRFVGELDALLETHGIRDDTLFVIVSDHGEGLYNHTILGHATHVYEDQLRIVWMMRGPGLPRGEVIRDRAGLITDVAPTILDMLGLPQDNMEGQSWAACWERDACPETVPWWSYGLTHQTRGLTGMASYHWPYKWVWRRSFKRIAFDVSRDAWETENLLENSGPHNSEPLKRAAESFRAERRRLAKVLEGTRPKKPSNADEELLRSLGYIGGSTKR